MAGIILFSPDLKDGGVLENPHIPVVTIERVFTCATACIECDNLMGGKLQAEHLIEIGKRNLVIMSGGSDRQMPADDRTRGALLVAEKYGTACREVRTTSEEYNQENYYARIAHLLEESRRSNPVDGILASSDVIASQVLQCAAAQGIRVPEDLAVVGFDDTLIAKTTIPTLTTIHQPIREMAQTAVQFLIRASEGRVVPTRTVLPVSLVVRGSTVRDRNILPDGSEGYA